MDKAHSAPLPTLQFYPLLAMTQETKITRRRRGLS
jgi:hypothetical protein